MIYYLLFFLFVSISVTCMAYFCYKPQAGTFAVGDAVTAFGNKGIVKAVANDFVHVTFEEAPAVMVFRLDGKLMKWHENVSLRKL